MGGTVIFRAPLQVQETKTKEGFQRVIAIVPTNARIVYLGVAAPSNEISLWAAIPARPRDAEGNPKPFAPGELGHIEFISAVDGQDIPENYQFRATVPTPQGVLFIFEKKAGSIVTLGGRG